MPSTIWFPLPDRDFDVTEVAVPWELLPEAGHRWDLHAYLFAKKLRERLAPLRSRS